MENGSGYGVLTDVPLRGPSQKPKLEGSSISSSPFDMPGHLFSGLPVPLPGPLGGEGIHMHGNSKVADRDRDFPSYETTSQDPKSYPHLVVDGPASDTRAMLAIRM